MTSTPLITVDCIVFSENKVLLIRRGRDPFKGAYALPGGFLDIGETLEQACIREMKEETGLDIKEDILKLVGVYSNPNRDPRGHLVSVAYLAESNLLNLRAGDDAASVNLVENWRDVKIAFDHKEIIENAWSLNKKK